MGKINLTQSERGYLLRISASDMCNYDCSFCHPPKNEDKNTLSNDEMFMIVKSIHRMYKLKTIHFTGGEPLLRKGFANLIKRCREEVGDEIDIVITTNAALLKNNVTELAEAGLTRINVSLHTLNQEKYEKITNTKVKVTDITEGIKKALRLGLKVKINSIVIRSFNYDDMYEISEYCFELGIIPRFLEFYFSGPIKEWFSIEESVCHDEILRKMEKKYGAFREDFSYRGNGAARYYVNNEGKVFGVVQNQSRKICVGCDRMRLSVNGLLRFCTFQPIDLREYLHSEDELKKILLSMKEFFVKRGNDYIGNRYHEIDYYFRWNQNDMNEKERKNNNG